MVLQPISTSLFPRKEMNWNGGGEVKTRKVDTIQLGSAECFFNYPDHHALFLQ